MADEPSDGSNKNRDAPTVRDLAGPELSSDTLPELVGLYVPPRPLPEPSQHRTLDLRSIRLSDAADPRRALTERRLMSPPKPSKPKRRLAPWLGALAVLLLAAAGWAFFWNSPPEPGKAQPLVRPSTVTKTLVTAGAAASRSVAPPFAASAAPSEPAAPAPTTNAETADPQPEGAGPSPPASKSARQRESAKKRKDPWLE